MRDLLTKLEDMGIDTYRFNDFKKVVDYIKDNEPRTCQCMIRAGARKVQFAGAVFTVVVNVRIIIALTRHEV